MRSGTRLAWAKGMWRRGMWARSGVALGAIGSLLLMALLHARALWALAASVTGPDPVTILPADAPRLASAKPRDASAILARNPFDSGWQRPDPRRAAPGPLEAQLCREVDVAVVSESSDADWSLASLVVTTKAQPRLVRRGDRLGEREVLHIGQNPVLASPAVWLSSGAGICQAVLRRRSRASPVGIPVPAPPAHVTPQSSRIRVSSPTEREIDRALIGEALKYQRELAHYVRVRASSQGRPVVQLVHVAPGSLPERLGFAEGDVILGVDGREIATPERALEVLIALRSARRMEVEVERDGRRVALGFRFR